MTDSGVLLRWVLIVTSVFLLQVGVVADIGLFGVHPELMLLLAICAGIAAGPVRGAGVGFAAGLLSDLMLQGPLGVSALAFAVVGFAVGSAEEAVLRSSRVITVAMTALASVVGLLLFAALSQLLGQRTLADPRLWLIVGIVSVFNAVLCVPAVALCRWAEGTELRTVRP
jgi:rod shape-determining protein MreD